MSYPIANHEDNIDKVRKGRPPTVAMRKDGPLRRWNSYWSKSTLDMMDALAAERGITRKELVVVAVSLMQVLAPAAAAHEVAEAMEQALVLPFLG